jgi:hypothetical protein
MPTRRLRSALASVATALAAATLASAGLVFAQGGLNPGAIHDAAKKKANPALNVSGTTAGLYPGGTVPLPLKVKNRTRFAVTLKKLTVKVGNASSACPGSLLHVVPFKPKTKLRKKKAGTVIVQVALSPAAPDACQNASFPITYKAKAVKTPAKKRKRR